MKLTPMVVACMLLTKVLCAQTVNQNSVAASFTSIEDGVEKAVAYSGESHLIFAEKYGKEIWIRLAESKAEDGEKSPHIDIDLCNFSGNGTYKAIDPKSRPCKDDFKWDIWWHGGKGVYANEASSSPCELILQVNGDTLSGTFTCDDLLLMNGTKKINIRNGSFTSIIRN